MHKEKVENNRGEIIEVEVISEEEARAIAEKAGPGPTPTLRDALAQGHVPLEDFARSLTGKEMVERLKEEEKRLSEKERMTVSTVLSPKIDVEELVRNGYVSAEDYHKSHE